jgi:predicted DNA binding CopG/RHH family protein
MPVKIPKFKSEAKEAEWWEAHAEVATEIMAHAIKSGSARRGPFRTVTMRLPVSDIQAAQSLAKRKGMPYQTYIKMMLHQTIQKELTAE